MRFSTALRKVHKWLALLIGIQLLLWMISGFAFSILSPDDIKGRQLLKSAPKISWKGSTEDFVQISKNYQDVLSISTTQLMSEPTYLVKTKQAEFMLAATNLEPLEISNDVAKRLAISHYKGEGELTNVSLVTETTLETRKFKLPMWKADFSDEENSSLYLSATTGKVFGIKTDSWRLFDIFWMLHIMDYSERDDFNNSLVIFVALFTSFIALSGLGLLFSVFSGQDFNLIAKFRRVPLVIASSGGGSTEIFVPQNTRLFNALENSGYQLPSNCGGGGTCGLCRIKVDPSLPVSAAELEQLTEKELNSGLRLACQLPLTRGLKVELPEQVLGQQLLSCRVVKNEFQTPFIKELTLEIPADTDFSFNAGEYVMAHIPGGSSALEQVQLPENVKPTWEALDVQQYSSLRTEPISRSYSMANPPVENKQLVFNVRLALPADKNGESGKASSYLYTLTEGDFVKVSGPFGHFHAAQNKNEMIFIGGGAGMAPLRSHILHQLESLHSQTKISFWFGARNEQELFYRKLFNKLQQKHKNFSWYPALSDMDTGSEWSGLVGMIDQVIDEQYLRKHPNIQLCDFYICGPPALNKAVLELLNALGVKGRNIHLDDFGN